MAEPIEPENGQTAQYRLELDAYNKWLEQDMSARFTMLSCMHDNLIREYEKYPTAKELWEVLKVAYGSTSTTRLRALNLRYRCNKTCDKGSSRIRKLPSSASMQSLHCYGNGAQEEVLGIGSYQLKLSTGCELLLSDVQYAPDVRCNLLSVTALMGQELANECVSYVSSSVNIHDISVLWHASGTHRTRKDDKGLYIVPLTNMGNWATEQANLSFIRYCENSKGYVMYGEYPNKGMTEIESRDVDFLEEDFPSISEVKGNLELYELRDLKAAHLSLSRVRPHVLI
ncbi:UNVERIFIED_CONTAM: hypothetical protein Sangu_2462900 [Sesamum angustifolium]|uniref:Retrovirus-related Pol polyprotein from transposon TNT 1-94-like beta-barrel domain-containing protein n=1 Tax=Sesamum angustifolium TaxID=2727405 RepID=A0AAW2JVI1_9LAMI